MTDEEIIEMAKQAGAWITDTGELVLDDLRLKTFAKLVAAKEREACAKICDSVDGAHLQGEVWGMAEGFA